jgi:hypothetical protein
MSFSFRAGQAGVRHLSGGLAGRRKDKLRDPYQGAIPFVLLLAWWLCHHQAAGYGHHDGGLPVSFVMFFMAGARSRTLGAW